MIMVIATAILIVLAVIFISVIIIKWNKQDKKECEQMILFIQKIKDDAERNG